MRLSKWYEKTTLAQQRAIIAKIHRLIHQKIQFRSCSCIDFESDSQLVYKKYNGLYFIVCIGRNDNGLLYFQSIPLFVELLDTYFDTVSELDLVFNFYKMHRVLDQIFIDGELITTKKKTILADLAKI